MTCQVKDENFIKLIYFTGETYPVVHDFQSLLTFGSINSNIIFNFCFFKKFL